MPVSIKRRATKASCRDAICSLLLLITKNPISCRWNCWKVKKWSLPHFSSYHRQFARLWTVLTCLIFLPTTALTRL